MLRDLVYNETVIKGKPDIKVKQETDTFKIRLVQFNSIQFKNFI